VFEELMSQWKSHAGLSGPPTRPIQLWQSAGCGIWISNEWGPAVPYGPVDHGDGNLNHGYFRLKGNSGSAGQIPEVQGWPELQQFLEALNAPESPVESVGCEKGFSAGEAGCPPVKIGSYVDVIFTEVALNDRPENFLLLTSKLAQAVSDCENWWASVEFRLQRNRALAGSAAPWGLMLHITNYGLSEEEARKFWRVTLSRLGKAIEGLPRDFRHEG
jgi:hypothetical protein